MLTQFFSSNSKNQDNINDINKIIKAKSEYQDGKHEQSLAILQKIAYYGSTDEFRAIAYYNMYILVTNQDSMQEKLPDKMRINDLLVRSANLGCKEAVKSPFLEQPKSRVI